MRSTGYGKFLWLGIFGISMGMLEAIVVVYLRELYYPSGFAFPLTPIPENILVTEMLREVSTIIMLLAVAAASGRGFYQRFSYFLFSFGVWDIFYYVWLKVLLGWPESLLTWDILFLIPVAWAGPVLAPVIVSLTMIMLGLLINKNESVRIGFKAWAPMALGSALILVTFMRDYAVIIIRGGFANDYFGLAGNETFLTAISNHTPAGYNWPLFALGEALILSAAFIICKKT